MNSTATIFARLASVAPSLATWNGQPAIFNEAAPDDFLSQEPKPSKPFLIIAVPTSDVALETFSETGRQIAVVQHPHIGDLPQHLRIDDVLDLVDARLQILQSA